MAITLDVNGSRRQIDVAADRSLLEVLRDEIGLTGSKYGCGEGECGACTVLVDGKATRSCVTRVGSVGARRITTIEGLAKNGRLHPVQQAFIAEVALQCGYCTTGMIMSAVALLSANSNPTDSDIVRGMQSNVCRCCAYPRIIAAIRNAAGAMKDQKPKASAQSPRGGAR
jgi:aerobic-type carbon monoxide dehydrogenase small subunit (CoxS/CutS family)